MPQNSSLFSAVALMDFILVVFLNDNFIGGQEIILRALG